MYADAFGNFIDRTMLLVLLLAALCMFLLDPSA